MREEQREVIVGQILREGGWQFMSLEGQMAEEFEKALGGFGLVIVPKEPAEDVQELKQALTAARHYIVNEGGIMRDVVDVIDAALKE